MLKWTIAGRLPQPKAPPHSSHARRDSVVGCKTLEQSCIDRIIDAAPHMAAQALNGLAKSPHLQEKFVRALTIMPPRTVGTAELKRWCASRVQLLNTVTAQQQAAHRSQTKVGPTSVPCPEQRLAKQLGFVINKVSNAIDQAEELEAKEMQDIENSWLNRMDGRQARRHMALLEKLGW